MFTTWASWPGSSKETFFFDQAGVLVLFTNAQVFLIFNGSVDFVGPAYERSPPYSMHQDNENIPQLLKKIAASSTKGVTVGELLRRLKQQGALVLSMILTVPFLLPVSIPGTSTPLGLLIALFGISYMTRKPAWLPRILLRRRLTPEHLNSMAERADRLLHRLDRLSKPRLLNISSGDRVRGFHGASLILCAILLMSPLPLPFSNTIPAYGILFLSLGSLRQDGVFIILGYALMLLAIIYITVVALLGTMGVQNVLN
jgi:hypothetical protein